MPKRQSTEQNPNGQARFLGRWFTGVRREGFLATLSPADWHTLCAILSFTTADGQRSFTVDQLALALGGPRDAARERLNVLATRSWQETPLIRLQADTSGEIYGVEVAPIEQLSQIAPEPEARGEAAPHLQPPPNSDAELHPALSAVGLNGFQVDWLLRTFPADRIRRQLSWLPARDAHNPPALLIRAIEQDWEAPKEAP